MPWSVGTVGPQNYNDGNQPQQGYRLGKQGDTTVSELHGRYYETTYRKFGFSAANQAAQATTVALATTYTGLVVSNPIASPVNLVVNKVSFALSVAPAAIASIGLITGFSTTANVTHTTPATPVSNFIGVAGAAPFGLADTSATLTGSPRWQTQLMGGFTAAALPSSPLVLADLEGSVILAPGAYLAIGSLTAVTGLGSISWEEVPV